MDERLRFVARLLEGEKMAPLCAEFGISRKTGYKIFDRYKDCGVQAFSDRSHRAHRQANRLPAPIEATIVRLKREYPGWGAPKIREKLRQQFTGPHLPAISTVHAVLDRHNLVRHRRRRRPRAAGDRALPADPAECPLVCRLQRRVPAGQSTVLLPADHHRLRQSLLTHVRGAVDHARDIRLHGLRADLHGVWPSPGDSDRQRRSVCVGACHVWAEQVGRVVAASGDYIERIKPGHPQQNGRHERMHLTLKREATKPAAANVLQQQARFDDFVTRYNTDRPHQALGMKVPADLYARSARVYRGLEELTYPFHDQTILVTGSAVSVSVDAKSISVMFSPARGSA